MARKGHVSFQDNVETNEEFEAYLENHWNVLICMEVYSEFCGHCVATGNAVKKGKLEIGGDKVAMVKAQADHIDCLSRFAYKSEPVFLYIMKGKLTRAVFGAKGIDICRVLEEELARMSKEEETGVEVPKYDINELLPEEAAKIQEDKAKDKDYSENTERLRVLTQAARKRRVCERLAAHLRTYNFILFWPHCHQAHYDLYEKWDMININVAGKETIQITEQMAKEVLYMSDIDPNEACMHALMNGESLVVLFKMFDTDDRDFVQVLRYALYEEIPPPKDDVPPAKQVHPLPAFERYASISKTARKVRRERHNAKLAKLQKEKEERERLAAEQARLAKEAEEDRIRAEKQRADEERLARLAAGLPADPEPEPKPVHEEEGMDGEEKAMTDATDLTSASAFDATTAASTTVATAASTTAATSASTTGHHEGEGDGTEEHKEEEEVFHSDVEVEDEEYIPPGGLFVPGLYAPPNNLAKANGLALFYPNVVQKLCPIESEFLPPHMLVMFNVDKRQEIQDVINNYKAEIIQVGFFAGDELSSMEHVAYTLKQYETMVRPKRYKDRLAVMVSRTRSLPLLQLAGFNPVYISSDTSAGERDCLQLFPVGYGDGYEEIESVKEEVVEVVQPPELEPESPAPEEVKDEEKEEEEEEIV